jgi:hypothetical protein
MNYTIKDVVRCINRWLSEDEVKKWSRVTYIAFLTQYDIRKWFIFKRATKYIHNSEPISKTQFRIGRFIVIESNDIDEIKDEDAVGEYSIPPQVEERIKTIINRYYNYKNWQISQMISKMLNLTAEKWRDYIGMDIDEYLYSERYKLRHREI